MDLRMKNEYISVAAGRARYFTQTWRVSMLVNHFAGLLPLLIPFGTSI